MEWQLKKIPKILNLYWGRNKPLSYMRYMTVLSFAKLNPDWEIRIFSPIHSSDKVTWKTNEHKFSNYMGKDYFDRLPMISAKITIIKFDFGLLDVSSNLPEVFKSDILRWFLLAGSGGVWSDFDICYVKPITELSINEMEFEDVNSVVCYHNSSNGNHYHSIGFLMSSNESPFYSRLFSNIKLEKMDLLNYQGMGRYLIESCFKNRKLDYLTDGVVLVNLPFHSIYPLSNRKVVNYYSDKKLNLKRDTVGLHWYAGNKRSSEFEDIIDEDNIKNHAHCVLLNEMVKINEI